MEKLLKTITNNSQGNPRLLLIYVLDWIAVFYLQQYPNSSNDFKILSFKAFPKFLVSIYNFIYSWKSLLIVTGGILTLTLLIWCKRKNSKAGFPLYLFIFYYLIYGWTGFFNFYVFSGEITLILNYTSEFILFILTIISFCFVVSDTVQLFKKI